MITPNRTIHAAREARTITAGYLQYFRAYGAPTNFRDLFAWLQEQGVTSGTDDGEGRHWSVSETKLRRILHKVFGLYGTPGQKPKSK